ASPLAPFDVAAADLDGDSDLDLLVTNESAGTVTVLRNRGGRAFDAAAAIPVGAGARRVRTAGLDRGGRAGPAASRHPQGAGLAVIGYLEGAVSVAQGNGKPDFFDPPSTFGAGARLDDAAAVDFDRDGLVDLVLADNAMSALNELRNVTFGPEVTARFGTVN